jgi:hypothetical protein
MRRGLACAALSLGCHGGTHHEAEHRDAAIAHADPDAGAASLRFETWPLRLGDDEPYAVAVAGETAFLLSEEAPTAERRLVHLYWRRHGGEQQVLNIPVVDASPRIALAAGPGQVAAVWFAGDAVGRTLHGMIVDEHGQATEIDDAVTMPSGTSPTLIGSPQLAATDAGWITCVDTLKGLPEGHSWHGDAPPPDEVICGALTPAGGPIRWGTVGDGRPASLAAGRDGALLLAVAGAPDVDDGPATAISLDRAGAVVGTHDLGRLAHASGFAVRGGMLVFGAVDGKERTLALSGDGTPAPVEEDLSDLLGGIQVGDATVVGDGTGVRWWPSSRNGGRSYLARWPEARSPALVLMSDTAVAVIVRDADGAQSVQVLRPTLSG